MNVRKVNRDRDREKEIGQNSHKKEERKKKTYMNRRPKQTIPTIKTIIQ